MNTTRIVPVICLLAFATGCSTGAPESTGSPESAAPTEGTDAQAGDHAGHATTDAADDGGLFIRNPGPGLWQEATSPPVRFEQDGTFGGEASHVESIAGAVVDRDANVYIYDAQRAELSGFSEDGDVLWRAGSAGSGPDQFEGVRGVAYDGVEAIWVVNQNGLRLDAWSTTGEHVRSVDLEESGVGRSFMGGFLSSDRVALLADIVYATAANEYVVLRLGDEPAIETRFRIGADPMTPIPPGVVLQLSHSFDGGKIYVGGWENYKLREYSGAGELLRSVTREVDHLRRPGFATIGDRYLGISFGGLAAPIVLGSGHWLVLASWPTNVDNPNAFAEMPAAQRPPIQWSSSVDLFDTDGHFLYSSVTPGSQIPDIGRPWAVGPRDRLYTVSADPVPHLRRYRVVLDPPDEP